MAGELSGVKGKLASAYDDVFRDNPELATQLIRSIGSDTVEGYEDAYDTKDAQEALANAAASGDLSEAYSNVYQQFPELRQKLKDAGADAFSDSDRQELADIANNNNIGDLYSECVRGNFNEVSGMLPNVGSTFDSVRDCQEAVSEASGLADSYDRLYQD